MVCIRNYFGTVDTVCSIEEISGPQYLRVSIVTRASKSMGAKVDVPKIYGFVHPHAAPTLMHSLTKYYHDNKKISLPIWKPMGTGLNGSPSLVPYEPV